MLFLPDYFYLRFLDSFQFVSYFYLWNEKRTSTGIGTRLVTGSGFVYRLDYATGKEGGSTIVIFDYPWGTFGQ